MPGVCSTCRDLQMAEAKIEELEEQVSLYEAERLKLSLYEAERLKLSRKIQLNTAFWVDNGNGSGTCSRCYRKQLAVHDDDNWQNYCGNCGARMSGVYLERRKGESDG